MVATISIWDKTMGYISWDAGRQLGIMEFEPSFAKEGLDVSPIFMPISEIASGNTLFSFPNLPFETFKGLPGMIADALPDNFGNKLIDAWLAMQGRERNSITPVERLCYMAGRGMGALEFKPALQRAKDKSEAINMSELVTIANEVLNIKQELKTNISKQQNHALKDIIRVGTSAGGARAKAVIAFNNTTGEIRSGQTSIPEGFAHWLLKFDGVTNNELADPAGYGRIEFAYYKMAIKARIEMSECRLLEENGRAHFMTKRFDRSATGEKYHMQTICGLAHFDYNNPIAYSYEQVFQVMRQLRLPYPDAEQMFRRMVFNIIARNQDDHTKNISFLMNKKGVWKLAPAYDVTYSYNPTSRWTGQHQLSVNGKRDNFNKADLLNVGKQMNIKNTIEIIDEIKSTVALWATIAKECGVLDKQIKSIARAHRLVLST